MGVSGTVKCPISSSNFYHQLVTSSNTFTAVTKACLKKDLF